METVSNLTSAASRAIWGDPKKDADTTRIGEEPRSGETGNTSAGEPYDKGNEGESEHLGVESQAIQELQADISSLQSQH